MFLWCHHLIKLLHTVNNRLCVAVVCIQISADIHPARPPGQLLFRTTTMPRLYDIGFIFEYQESNRGTFPKQNENHRKQKASLTAHHENKSWKFEDMPV